MIDWLSDWLKQLILMIMLATFVDLLLPNQNMQRYVKTVLGLFILMTLLNPIFALFQREWDLTKMADSVERLNGSRAVRGTPDMIGKEKPLAAILQDGHKLQAVNNKHSLQLVEAKLAEMIKQDVRQQKDVKIQDVSLKTYNDKHGAPQIDTLRVTLHYIDESKTVQPNPSRIMEPVTPVSIEIKVDQKRNQPDITGDRSITPEMKRTKEQVHRMLQEKWQLKADQVMIIYDIETGK